MRQKSQLDHSPVSSRHLPLHYMSNFKALTQKTGLGCFCSLLEVNYVKMDITAATNDRVLIKIMKSLCT